MPLREGCSLTPTSGLKHTGVLSLLLLLVACNPLLGPVATGPKVGNFALLDQAGEFHELYYYSDFKAVVLFSHGLGSQIVRNQVPARILWPKRKPPSREVGLWENRTSWWSSKSRRFRPRGLSRTGM